MYEKIKQEVDHAMRLIALINVSGDAVDVVAAARQALRNVRALCDAAAKPMNEEAESDAAETKESEGADETA